MIALLADFLIVFGFLFFSGCTPSSESQKPPHYEPPPHHPPTPTPPPPPPVDVHIQAYVNRYIVDFGDEAAPVDLFWGNPAANEIVGDLRCRELFGQNMPHDFEKSTRLDNNEMFKEYLAGQILTALSFPTPRQCFFKNNAGVIKSLYRQVSKLKPAYLNNIQASNIDRDHGGVRADNNIYAQTIFQYHAPRISKWLVAESDYNNVDYFAFYLSGINTSFAYDFEHAGDETQSIETRSIVDDVYDNTGNLIDPLLTQEMVWSFINQLKAFIKDKPGENDSSVLAQIVLGQRVQRAKNDFTSNLDLTQFYQKIKSQITVLISKLEDVGGAVDANFEQREQARLDLAEKLAQRGIPNFNKKAFSLALLGQYYLVDPSDLTQLQSLDADVLAQTETQRLQNLNGYNPAQPKAMKLSFNYPTNRVYCLVKQGLSLLEGPAVDKVKTELAGFTLHKEVALDAPNLQAEIDSCISQRASLIVVGSYIATMPAFSIANSNEINTIFTWYKNQNAATLPRYIISSGSNYPSHGIKEEDSFYKNSAGERIILYPLVDQTKGFSFHGVAMNVTASMATPPTIKPDPINLNSLLEFIQRNSQ